MEVLQTQRTEEQDGDRERAYQKGEESFDQLSLREKIDMIKQDVIELESALEGFMEPIFRKEYDQEQYEVEQERNADHVLDNKI